MTLPLSALYRMELQLTSKKVRSNKLNGNNQGMMRSNSTPCPRRQMRLWYVPHRWPAKAQASLCIRAVSSELSLSHTWSMKVDKGSDQLDECACVFEEFEMAQMEKEEKC